MWGILGTRVGDLAWLFGEQENYEEETATTCPVTIVAWDPAAGTPAFIRCLYNRTPYRASPSLAELHQKFVNIPNRTLLYWQTT